jgi:uncharacterized protein (DUF58 family)
MDDERTRPLNDRAAEAAQFAARLPDLVIAARRVARSVMHGVHGRRVAGPGETFWQFRPFASGEPASRIDWRRSARGAQAYVREREWEAAQTLWIWIDRSASMRFGSSLAKATKLDRAVVIGLALADLAVRGGERVGLLGLTRPIAARGVIERFAEVLAHAEKSPAEPLPPPVAVAPRSRLVLIGDFLSPIEQTERAMSGVFADGVGGHVLVVADPIEETFPFAGHVEFFAAAGGERLRAPRAEQWRKAYLEKLAEHRERLRAAAARRGADLLLHRTDASPAEALLALHARLSEPGAAAFSRSA